jgi:AcrR family transcriptional regulator
MTEAPSKREQMRQERRQQILDAALTVFGQKGFHSANVSDVAARAGVSQGTIYWYFDSKDELLTAAILSFFDSFGQEMLSDLQSQPTASGKLRAMAGLMEGFATDAQGLFPLFLEYWASSQRRAESAQVWSGLLVEFKDVLAAVIQEGIEAGEFRPVDADNLIWSLMAAYDGLAAYSLFVPDLDLAGASRALMDTLIAGLAASGQAGSN